MLEVHDLLSCSMSRLAVSVASGNGGEGVPTVVRAVAAAAGGSLSPGDSEIISHRQELDRLSMSINNMTRMEEEQREINRMAEKARDEMRLAADAARDKINNIRLEIRTTKGTVDKLKSEKRVLVVKHFESRNDEAARQFYARQLSELDQEIEDNKSQQEALIAALSSVECPSPQQPNNLNKRVYSLLTSDSP
jgi:chromosome segregation ATPase